MIRKTVVGAVLVLGLVAAAPALAAHIAGTTVKVQRNIDVLNGQDQTVYVRVTIDRKKAPAATHQKAWVDVFEHRAQNEDPQDLSYGHQEIHAPVIGTQRNNSQEYEDGDPCLTCFPIDKVCELIGDRC